MNYSCSLTPAIAKPLSPAQFLYERIANPLADAVAMCDLTDVLMRQAQPSGDGSA